MNYGVVDVLDMSSLHSRNCHKLGMLNKLMYRTNMPMHSSYTTEIGAANKMSTAKHVNTPTIMQKRTQYGKGSNFIIPVQQFDHLRCLYATLLYGSPLEDLPVLLPSIASQLSRLSILNLNLNRITGKDVTSNTCK